MEEDAKDKEMELIFNQSIDKSSLLSISRFFADHQGIILLTHDI